MTTETNPFFVIGSGPSGVSCATALLERGHRVILLDAGIELEENKKKILSGMKKNWDETKLAEFRHPFNSKNRIKLSYGSHYPYAEASAYFDLQMDDNIHCLPSFAKGGLSNVWGGFIERYNETHLLDWPIPLTELEPYYRKVFSLLQNGDPHNTRPRVSQQAEKLLGRLAHHKEKLQQAGFAYDKAPLAVQFTDPFNHSDCRYCGMCLYGCPLQLIYSSSRTLATLQKDPKFSYLNNIIVDDIQEAENKTVINACHRISHERLSFESARTFIACGPIISTQLALKAANHYDQPVLLQDSSHFILPCLMHDRVKNVSEEKLHTLCQFYLRLLHPDVASHTIHLQVYTYTHHYKQKLGLLAPFLQPLLDRIVVIQGQLDSKDSHGFKMAIKKNP